MKTVAIIAAVACTSRAEDAGVTPVQKVLQLMDGMMAKGKKEKHDEEVQFAAYKQFCDDTTAEKTRLISEASDKIGGLNADISKFADDIARLTKEITQHNEDIATWNSDIAAATKVRAEEKATYDKTHADYSESIDALERAIAVLKKEVVDRKQASFVQISALQEVRMIPADAKKVLASFLAHSESDTLEAPEANAYENQSGGVIEMLEKLLDKFVAERTTLEKEESNTKQAFTMLTQDLKGQIEQATSDVDLKTEEKAKKESAKATAEGDVADTTKVMDDDKAYLRDLVATCTQKSADFEARSKLRAEELVAIQKAIDIISSGDVAGSADKHLPALVQNPALAQLRAGSSEQASQARAAKYLQTRAGELQSRVLAALAVRTEADPFTKVIKMIKELIVRLMEEANEEAEHKGWCDTELSTNEQTRKEKTDVVTTLTAEKDQLKASIAKLGEEVAELNQQVADLDKAMAEATELRQKEKAKNAETVKDAKAAQVAVAKALTVLKDFYEKAGEATAFVQSKAQPEAPEIFDKTYNGMGSESGGVVGMLEVIESDFARLESETANAEATSQDQYDRFMTDSSVDKGDKETESEHKADKKKSQSGKLATTEEDLARTQTELDAALAYFDKLKPSCVDSGNNYEDRTARRKEEIESLQEALKMLTPNDM